MKTISFAFNKVNREFLVTLLDYYDLRQKEKALKGKISSLFSNEQEEEDDENLTLSNLCDYIVRKDFSHPIFDKMGKLFVEVTTDKLADHIFKTMELNLGMYMPRYEICNNILRLKCIVERSYTEELPDSKFVEEFISELDKILAYFGLNK